MRGLNRERREGYIGQVVKIEQVCGRKTRSGPLVGEAGLRDLKEGARDS